MAWALQDLFRVAYPSNALLAGSENQSLPAVPFREPLADPGGHPLQLLVPQRFFQNSRLREPWFTGPRTNCSAGYRMSAGVDPGADWG